MSCTASAVIGSSVITATLPAPSEDPCPAPDGPLRASDGLSNGGPTAHRATSTPGGTHAVRQPRSHRTARLAGLPRHDELRQRLRPALGARRGRGRAHRAGRGRGRRHLLRHRRRLLGRRQRGGDRPPAAEVPHPGRAGGRHQGPHAGDAGRERRRACPASTSCRASTRRSPAWAWTTSTSTRSTGGTTGRRSRRPWRPCTTWSGPARPATSAPPACSPGSSPRPSTWPTPTGGPGSSPCRTTTTSSTARRSGR